MGGACPWRCLTVKTSRRGLQSARVRAAPAFGLREVSSSGPYFSLSTQSEGFRRATVVGLSVLVALYYGLGHLNWYFGTPLGRVPVLDERENLDLASAILGGTLPHEPFYRAPGYALVLAGLRVAGVPPTGLFPAALMLGVALHGIGAGLASSLAGRWFGNASALATGLLYALDPVLVHFATQALDATLGLTLFVAGLGSLSAAVDAGGRPGPWARAGLLWAAAALVRPNYLLVWILAPALALAQALPRGRKAAVVASALAGMLLFGAQAAWQRRVCGEAGFLPWQGAYNLWAANRPGSNGRYFTQRVSLTPELARANPARAESVLLYRQETGGAPPDIARMDAHWRASFVAEVTEHPVRWSALMARKLYALANNWEQYNNKTFAFHKARSPWLSWNPVCWGLLLCLAVPGAVRLRASSRRTAALVAGVAALCAASTALFFVSARFRLPLAAVAALLAGGALGSASFWRSLSPRGRLGILAGVLAAALVTFSRLGGVADRSTFVQDHVLLARASFTVGDDVGAIREANEALKLQPWHPDAGAIIQAASEDIEKRKETGE
jgi:hypothetical protein